MDRIDARVSSERKDKPVKELAVSGARSEADVSGGPNVYYIFSSRSFLCSPSRVMPSALAVAVLLLPWRTSAS